MGDRQKRTMDGPQKSIPGSDISSPFISSFSQFIPVNIHIYIMLIKFIYFYMLKIIAISGCAVVYCDSKLLMKLILVVFLRPGY